MIDHCDSSFLHRRFDGERIPLSHQLPPPTAVENEARCQITLRDKRWAECKLFQVPSRMAVSTLRLQNDGVVKLLAASPAPFPADLTRVELLFCKLCEIFCGRCELETIAETRRPGILSHDFVRRSLEMALADEEELPPGHL